MGKLVIASIVFYQKYLSWDHCWRYFFAGKRVCKYYPSCSDYTVNAIERFGFWRGLWQGIKRLLRCNPFSLGGVDEV